MKCYACPRKCGADREKELGFCGGGSGLKISKIMIHRAEEPVISGKGGSGAVFFAGCALRCVFCQNAQSSFENRGEDFTADELYDAVLRLADEGVDNIDFITAGHYAARLLPVLERLKKRVTVPFIYNSGGYENVNVIRALDGLIDVYLPDFKYADSALAAALSGAPDYFLRAQDAIREMVRQTGAPRWQGDKLLRGTVIRHLILPGHVDNSLRVLDWIGETFAPGQVLVSLMRQYTPMGNLPAPFDRRVTEEEYQAVLSWMYLNDLEGFTQEAESADRGFIPDF